MDFTFDDRQMGFPYLQAAEQPEMAPIELVAEFENELEAINYSIDAYARKHGFTFTQTNLAGQLGMTKQTLSKLRQGDVGVPRNRLRRLVEVTGSYVLIQYHAFALGLTVRTSEQERQIKEHAEFQERKIQRLESELAAQRDVTQLKAQGESK